MCIPESARGFARTVLLASSTMMGVSINVVWKELEPWLKRWYRVPIKDWYQ